MKKYLFLLLAFLSVGTANASVITDTSIFTTNDSILDFDEASITSGELISNQYSTFGIVFTGGLYGGDGAYSSGDHVSGTYLDSFSGGSHLNLWTINFSSIVTSAGAYFEIDADNSLILSAMLAGSVVETASFSDGVCCSTMEFAGFTGINFDSIEITTSLANGRNFYMDELHYSSSTSVPEPTSLALLGLGLAGFGFSRKKKKT